MREWLVNRYESPALRFLVVGCANFIITYAIYLLALLVLEYHIAFGISFISGLLFTSIATIHHTFRTNLKIIRIFAYGAYYLLYFLLNINLINLLIKGYRLDPKWAPALSLIFLIPLHYLFSKALVTGLKRFDDDGPSLLH